MTDTHILWRIMDKKIPLTPSPTLVDGLLYLTGDSVAVAVDLDSKLVVLAKPASLRTLVPKYRADVIQTHRLRQVMHTVFQIGSAHRGRAFWTQSQQIAAPVFKSIGLFFYDVGDFADAAHKQAGVFKYRRVDAPVSKPVGNFLSLGLKKTPVFLLIRHDVYCASRGLEQQKRAPLVSDTKNSQIAINALAGLNWK